MENKLINGKNIADDIQAEIKNEVAALTQKYGRTPGLAVVLVGEDPASQVYVRNKHKACENIGIRSIKHTLPADTSEADLLALVNQMNHDDQIDGILIQLPLPKQIDEKKVLNAMNPAKDVDGFHPVNVGKLVVGERAFRPCTPAGVQELLIRSGVKTEGSHVVVVGRSNIVGKPVAILLMQKQTGANATVTVCHSQSRNLKEICAQADILIAAIGKAKMITSDMVKAGAVVIDVGVNRVDDPSASKGYKLVGDVDFDGVLDKVKLITPVPGGVGPMTIAMLMKNTVEAFKQRMGL